MRGGELSEPWIQLAVRARRGSTPSGRSWIPAFSTFDENLEEGCTPSDLVLFFGNNTGSLALKFFDFLEEFMSDCMSGITKAEFCSRVEGSNVILS